MRAVLACIIAGLALAAEAQDMRSRLKGLVFEAEEWSEPKDGWVKDQHPADKWCLWTQEEDVNKKRSGGQSLQSPLIKEDRARPEDGAPPLHTHITGIPNGLYQAWMNGPARYIALSFDGKKWSKHGPAREVDLGIRRITDGTFDLWVDDRFAFPPKFGWCYYDYVRLEEVKAPTFSHITAFTLPDGRTQISWITDVIVPTGVVEFGSGGRPESGSAKGGTASARNHAVVLEDLRAGEPYTARIVVESGGHRLAVSPRFEFLAGARPTPGPSKRRRIALSVAEPTDTGRRNWPVTSGVPFGKGELASADDVRLLRAPQAPVPAQFETLSRWPDGSVRWLLLDFLADTTPAAPTAYVLDVAPGRSAGGGRGRGGSRWKGRSAGGDRARAIARREGDAIVLDTGALLLWVGRERLLLFYGVAVDGNGDGTFDDSETVTGPARHGNAWITDSEGRRYAAGPPDRVVCETNGPVRATVRAEGDFVSETGSRLFRYRARISAFRGSALLRLQWTIGNSNTGAAMTPLSEAAVRIPLRNGGQVTGLLSEGGGAALSAGGEVRLLQDYDDHWTCTRGGETTEGTHGLGLAQLASGHGSVTALVRDFWQTYPKGIVLTPDSIVLQLLPPLPADQFTREQDRNDVSQIALFYCYKDGKYQVKRGLEYTADIMVSFGSGPSSPSDSAAHHFQHPLFAAASPDVYCRSGAFWGISPRAPEEFPRYWQAFEESFRNLEQGRVARHEYGWMNYGDWWGERSWNWGNSEYDLQYVLAVAFAQTGRLDFLRRGDEMARHNTTVDVVHHPWQTPMRELVYAHSVGHVGGFFERNDPRISSTVWSMSGFIAGARDGSGGHTYQGGNFLYGFLTGDRRYLEVAETVCRNQAVTYTPRWSFGIERSCGWSLCNAMSAYESTLDPFYLNAARIYLEKAFELQDPETGGWRMRQGKPECDCPDAPHIGGKAFAAGVLLHGLLMFDRLETDERVRRSIVRGVDWMLDHSWNEEKSGFRYKTGCAKYANHGWYTTLVTDGIAYAYKLTGEGRYRDFLLRTLPTPASKRTGSGRSSGKSFASHFRHLPHVLHAVRSWGVEQLPVPPPPARVVPRRRVYLDDRGEAELSVLIRQPGTEPVACSLEIDPPPDGWRADKQSLRWSAPPGLAASPTVRLSVAAGVTDGRLRLTCIAGDQSPATLSIAAVRVEPLSRIGHKTGFLGPEGHFTLAALLAVGCLAEPIDPAAITDLTPYRTVVMGSDVLGDGRLRSGEVFRNLAGFVKAGGRLVLFQINDEHWQTDFLPFEVVVEDRNGTAGEIRKRQHLLFKDIGSIAGTVCYDTVVVAGSQWSVLAADSDGGPAVLRAAYGKGEILIIQPSVDRWAAPNPPDVGLDTAVCRRVMANLAAYLSPLGP